LRALGTPLLRDLFWAPELERYLGVGAIDLALTDQLEAVRVRVEAGIQLLESRVLAACVAACRRQGWLCAALGIAVGAGSATILAGMRSYPVFSVATVMVASAGAGFAGERWAMLRRDLKLLRALKGRYGPAVARCSDTGGLLEVAKAIEAEVRTVAGRKAEAAPTP
jgi:hypothetical protein